MYTRQITSEEKYTLAEARRIINVETKQKKEKFLHKAKQKLLGILAIGMSIASPLLLGDATISVLMLPLGIYAIVTKENILN